MAPSRKTIRIAVSALLAAILALSCACAFALGGVSAWAQGDDGQREIAAEFYKGVELSEPEVEGELLESGGGEFWLWDALDELCLLNGR